MRTIQFVTLFIFFIGSGCASSRETGPDLAHGAGWQWSMISTGKFDLATAQPDAQRGETLWIYIEGDGRAFLSPSTPASDPTPSDPIALRLALAQPGGGAVAYLGRPCQYALREHSRNCMQPYWTNARYAPEVIDSMNQAIDILKKQSDATQLILAGYSGGGAIAVLVAAKRRDVAGIVTVAADLDLAYWARRDELTPLTGSLDPVDFAGAVASIPQVHFTGAQDETVGTDVVQVFTNRLPANAPVRIIEVPGFTHTCCWAEQWARLITGPDVKSVLPRRLD